jgi:signal peptidase II
MRLTLALLLLVCCVGCDQATKHLATKMLCGNPPFSCLSNTLRLEYALNPGGFLSVGGNFSPQVRSWLFLGFNAAFLLGASYLLVARWNMRLVNFVALLLILAGGIGNLIDRVFHDGLVTDFLNLGIGSLRTGIFNVADVALTAGVLLLMLTCRDGHLTPTPPASGDGPAVAD